MTSLRKLRTRYPPALHPNSTVTIPLHPRESSLIGRVKSSPSHVTTIKRHSGRSHVPILHFNATNYVPPLQVELQPQRMYTSAGPFLSIPFLVRCMFGFRDRIGTKPFRPQNLLSFRFSEQHRITHTKSVMRR